MISGCTTELLECDGLESTYGFSCLEEKKQMAIKRETLNKAEWYIWLLVVRGSLESNFLVWEDFLELPFCVSPVNFIVKADAFANKPPKEW